MTLVFSIPRALRCALTFGLGALALVSSATFACAQSASHDTAQGIELYQQGKAAEAAEVVKQAVRQNPNDANAWTILGDALFARRKYADARKAYERAIAIKPDLGAAHAGLANVLRQSEHYFEALDEVRIAQKFDPDNLTGHFVAGAVLLWQGDTDSALKEITTVLGQKPDDGPANLLKARALLALCAKHLTDDEGSIYRCVNHELRDAVPAMEKFLRSDPAPENGDFWRKQAAAMIDYLSLYDRAVAQDPDPVIPFRPVSQDARITAIPTLYSPPRVSGTEAIKVLVLLAADGHIKNILALEGANIRLSEKAVRSAEEVRFEPALKDGRPVGEVLVLRYYFRTGG